MNSKKQVAIERFVRGLKDRLGDHLFAVHLFGSMAKGTSRSESDIDMLVVFSGIIKEEAQKVTTDLSFEISCEQEEVIQTVLMSEQEYRKGLGRSPFLWEAVVHGRALFLREVATKWALDFGDYLKLAREYLTYAEDAANEEKRRLAIDAGYNAAELLVKALIISTEHPLASSHGGVVGQFGRLFVLSGRASSDLGRNLHRALDLRAQARYNPRADLTEEDVRRVLDVAQELLKIAEQSLGVKG